MSKSAIKYLAIAILYRLTLVVVISYSINSISSEERIINQYFGFKANDYGYFIPPAENLYSKGLYSYRDNTPYAGRMPGYAALYLSIRPFANQTNTLFLIILIQTILGGIGAFYLAKSAYILFKHKRAFIIAYLLSFLYPVSVFFDYQTMTEGLSISLLSIAIYVTIKGIQQSKLWMLAFAGLLLTWIVFLRPFLGLLLPSWGLYILWKTQSDMLGKLKTAAVFSIPFILMIGAWTYRNHIQFNQFIPLQTPGHISYGKIYSKGWGEIRKLIRAWGGETAYFEPGSEAEWFRKDVAADKMPVATNFYDNKPFSEEDMVALRALYKEFLSNAGYDSILDQKIIDIAKNHFVALKQQQSFSDKAKSQLLPLRNMTLRFGSAYMPPLLNTHIDKLLRIIFSLSYLAILLMAIWGLIIQFKSTSFLFIPIIANILGLLYVSTIFEFRYFLTTMPFAFLVATASIIWVYENLNPLKRNVLRLFSKIHSHKN